MSTFIGKTFLKTICTLPKCQHTSLRYASNAYLAAVMKTKDAKELVIEDVKRLKLKDTQLRIQVAYCSVNIFDVLSFSDSTRKFPFVPGYEFSGEVIEVGKEAEKVFKKDDRIVALNFTNYGGMAKECVVDYRDVWTTPSEIKLKDAAVITYSNSLALYTFGILASLKECNNVVVSVGPAGLGLAAVDIAANIYKAKVVAVTDTDLNSELTREKGAFTTMHYNEKVQKNVFSAFGDKRADVVFDAVGGEIYDAVASCISPTGQIFTPIVGKVTVPPPHASLTHISLDGLRKQDLNVYRQVVQDSLEMAGQGLITAQISEKFDFKDVNKAIAYINSKQCTGKVVIEVN